jgi:hypothetical protein
MFGSGKASGGVAVARPCTRDEGGKQPGWASCSRRSRARPAETGVGPSGSYVSIVFSDNPAEVCSAFQETHAADEIATYAGSTVFSLFLLLDSATGPQPGTYAIGASGPTQFPVEVEVAVADATCQRTEIDATAGTVTLTAVSESTIRGSFDVTFGASGSLRGGFDLPDCAVTDTDAGGTYSDVCQH